MVLASNGGAVAAAIAALYIGSDLDESGLVALHRLTLSAASRTGRARRLPKVATNP